ncbi:MAG: pimeloyl-CoA dehydrogenase small subunit [Rhodospirillaceae bacterium]|nr:pimeloyl-CoA dehydrogenase small subunit [Rhodospirillaceae bacterium]
MDFDYTEEQTLFSDSLRRLLEDKYSDSQRRDVLAQDDTYHSEALWQDYAELGLLALPFDEGMGGFGGTAIDVMVTELEFGRHLSLEPYLASVILAGGALRLAGNADQQSRLIEPMVAGEMKLACAFGEPQSRYDAFDVETRAEKSGNGFKLSGRKAVALGADCADKLIVSARIAGDVADKDGLCLFIVDTKAPGVSVNGYRLSDGRGAAEVTLDGAEVGADDLVGEEGNAWPVIDHVVDLGTAALCAEAVGAMERANDLTLEFLKTREQFGRPIGKFQVLQHRMVDMMIEKEQSESLALLACMDADKTDAVMRQRAVSAAKVQIGNAARLISEASIQMHGGIGVTEEYMLGAYVKRLSMVQATFGDVDHHVQRFGALTAAA